MFDQDKPKLGSKPSTGRRGLSYGADDDFGRKRSSKKERAGDKGRTAREWADPYQLLAIRGSDHSDMGGDGGVGRVKRRVMDKGGSWDELRRWQYPGASYMRAARLVLLGKTADALAITEKLEAISYAYNTPWISQTQWVSPPLALVVEPAAAAAAAAAAGVDGRHQQEQQQQQPIDTEAKLSARVVRSADCGDPGRAATMIRFSIREFRGEIALKHLLQCKARATAIANAVEAEPCVFRKDAILLRHFYISCFSSSEQRLLARLLAPMNLPSVAPSGPGNGGSGSTVPGAHRSTSSSSSSSSVRNSRARPDSTISAWAPGGLYSDCVALLSCALPLLALAAVGFGVAVVASQQLGSHSSYLWLGGTVHILEWNCIPLSVLFFFPPLSSSLVLG